jgi:hypothetical protein
VTEDIQFFDLGKGNKPYSISGAVIEQRRKLAAAINKEMKRQEITKRLSTLCLEETTYTWFNRLVALCFMEVSQYLPSNLR